MRVLVVEDEPYLAEAVRDARDAGAHVVLASGRSPHGMTRVADLLRLHDPELDPLWVVASNGAVVFRYPPLDVVHEETFDARPAVRAVLESHPDVASVNYAGLPTSPWYAAANKYAPKGVGAVLSFELKGGVDAGRALVDNLSLFSHLANIGDVRSLVIHPASTTHSQLSPEEQLSAGVTPGLVRLSVGLENIDDLKADLEAGLAAARAAAETDTVTA